MENLNLIIAKNLAELRKRQGLTQLELAEKLNYSDKAVSKWEQGESLPGIEVLYKLSRIYGVSLDELVGDVPAKAPTSPRTAKRHRIITLLGVLAVWFCATVCYIAFELFGGIRLWIFFCWAVPASLVVTLVFDVIWHSQKFFFIILTALLWTFLVCVCLQFIEYNIWVTLAAGIPLEVGILLWARLVRQSDFEKQRK